MTCRIYLLLYVLFISSTAHAQAWAWGKGSIGNNVAAWPVATDHTGNVYVAGASNGPISFDGYNPVFTTTGSQCVVAKYDSKGHFLWARSTQNSSNTFLINITTDTAGNCYLLGWLQDSVLEIGSLKLHNTEYPYAQYFIAKYDPDGDVLWAKNGGGRSGSPKISPIVFDAADAVKMMRLGAICADPGGNIYVTTGFNLPSISVGRSILFNADSSGITDDIMMVKYDGSGNILWANSCGGRGEDIPTGITITPSGAIYISGFFNSDSIAFGPSLITDTCTGAQKWNAFIARYDDIGDPVWANSCGTDGETYGAGIGSDPYNNVYMVGGAKNDIILGGRSIANPYPGKPFLYLVKFEPTNNTEWYKAIGSAADGARGYSIAVSRGVEWVCGALNNELNIDGHSLKIPQASVDPVFIAGFDAGGSYLASAALQSGSDQQAGIACDSWGEPYVCANYKYPCSPFIVANDVLPNAPSDQKWLYIAKYEFPGGDGGGSGSDLPDTLHITIDTTICPNDNIALLAPHGYSLYSWSDGSSDTLLHVNIAGAYWVIGVGKNDTTIVDTFKVATNPALCNCSSFLPDAFTPNGDGENDTYGPVFQLGCVVTKYAFSIFDRWGQRVFYSENPSAKWNGTYNGVPVQLGVYMFYVKFTTNPNLPEHIQKGDVTLIR